MSDLKIKEEDNIEDKKKNKQKVLSYSISFTHELNAKIKELCLKTGHQTVASLIRSLLIQEIKDKNIK